MAWSKLRALSIALGLFADPTPSLREGAGFWIRALARSIDTMIHFAVGAAVGIAAAILVAIGSDRDHIIVLREPIDRAAILPGHQQPSVDPERIGCAARSCLGAIAPFGSPCAPAQPEGHVDQ